MNWPETESTAAPVNPPVTPAPTSLPVTGVSSASMAGTAPYDDPGASRALKARAAEALGSGEEYVRNNPLATMVAAIAIGTVVGAILGALARREEPEPMPVSTWQSARDWFGHTYSGIKDRIPEAPHISMPKHFPMPKFRREPTFMDRLEDAVEKLRFW